MSRYDDVKKAYEASPVELTGILGQTTGQNFVDFRKKFDPIKKIEECTAKEITIITLNDNRYPGELKSISDPPLCLYVKGDIELFDFQQDICIGVVGTRRPTAYGSRIAYEFSYELAGSNICIVSGLAMGIDGVAHTAAIDAKGRTIAFLGCGVDLPHPPSNRLLYEKIIAGTGLVISEFPPGMLVQKGLFVARNRLVSGISKGVLVVEGLRNSGSLITARCAATQGKDIFAPPAPITSRLSEAPNILLKQGAKLVTSAEDILEEYKVQMTKTNGTIVPLSSEERILYDVITTEPLLADELMNRCKMPIYTVLSILSSLELKAVVEKQEDGKYCIKR